MSHHTSNAPAPGHQQISEAAARLGDGSQLKAKDWSRLSYAERTALHGVNTEAYRNLQAGRDATDNGAGWRPGTNAGSSMTGANL